MSAQPVPEHENVVPIRPGQPDTPHPWERPPQRRPVIPGWMAQPETRKHAVTWAARHAAHHVAFHAVRTPKYLIRTAVCAPRGLALAVYHGWRWVFDREGHELRVHAVATRDQKAYATMARIRKDRVRTRLLGLVTGAAAAGAPGGAHRAGVGAGPVAAVRGRDRRPGVPRTAPERSADRSRGRVRGRGADHSRRDRAGARQARPGRHHRGDQGRAWRYQLHRARCRPRRARLARRAGPAVRRHRGGRDGPPRPARVRAAAAAGVRVARARARPARRAAGALHPRQAAPRHEGRGVAARREGHRGPVPPGAVRP